TEDPETAKKAGKKVVEREVTEITTPGITMSENLLDHKRNNYIVSLHYKGEVAGIAFSDISTGEFGLSEVDRSEVPSFLQSLTPSEILLHKSLKNSRPKGVDDFHTTLIDEWIYEGNYGYDQLTDHFKTHSL